MMNQQSPETIRALRRAIRSARRHVSEAESRAAALAVVERVSQLMVFREAQRVAAYLAFDGELDPTALLSLAWEQGKQTYVPILRGDEPMVFAPHGPDTTMQKNYFGILEPVVPVEQLLQASELDLVLTPLVAFDAAGFRLGMGGGFYDRTFARRREESTAPCLLGIAYELQHHHQVPHRDWDIPLDGVVTEQRIHDFSGKLV